MSPNGNGFVLQKALRKLTIATVVLYLLLSAFFVAEVAVVKARRDDTRAAVAESRTALCALRLNLQQTIASEQKFLQDNPHGIPDTLQSQRDTIFALRDLNCEPLFAALAALGLSE